MSILSGQGQYSLGSRFYPMLYMLTRIGDAKDFGTGLPLKADLLGRINALQVHHIFPKSILYKYGYGQTDVNSVANFCFLTQDTNLVISDKDPHTYLSEIENKYPGVLSSQWIPLDRNLWKVENFLVFLTERRKLLADASNIFLDELLNGLSLQEQSIDYSNDIIHSITAVSEIDEELMKFLLWIEEKNIPIPELSYEINDLDTGENFAIVELAWPNGLQVGYSQPLALILEDDLEIKAHLNQAGFMFFNSIDSLKEHIEKQDLVHYSPSV